MITERRHYYNLGWCDTVQTYYTCLECGVETNVVLWRINIKLGNHPIEYTCPTCGTTHNVDKSYQ